MIFKETCSSAELSNVLMITKRQVRNLATKGVVKKLSRGNYAFFQSVVGYIEYLNDQIPLAVKNSKGVKSAQVEYAIERAKLLKHKAEIARLEVEEKTKLLVSKKEEDIEKFLMARFLRDEILAVPERIAPQLANEDDANKMYRLCESELVETLTKIADGIDSGDFIENTFPLPLESSGECEHWH